MPYIVIKGPAQHVVDTLNGAIEFGVVPQKGLPVDGLTLIFTTPAQTVTFTAADPGGLVTPDEILDQLQTALTGVTVTYRSVSTAGGRGVSPGGVGRTLVLQLDTGLELADNGTANDAFGVPADGLTGSAMVAPERLLAFGPENLTAQYYALVGPETP
jgi:hypothetical protein